MAGGWRLQTRATMEHWVARLSAEKAPRYSRALLETLVLIAYRQPITRGEIEEVRGVAVSSNIVRTLQDRRWVREVGFKEVPGKPALLGTTSEFLDYFNLKRLDELPPLGELVDIDTMEAALAAELDVVEDGGVAANDDGGEPTADGEPSPERDDPEVIAFGEAEGPAAPAGIDVPVSIGEPGSSGAEDIRCEAPLSTEPEPEPGGLSLSARRPSRGTGHRGRAALSLSVPSTERFAASTMAQHRSGTGRADWMRRGRRATFVKKAKVTIRRTLEGFRQGDAFRAFPSIDVGTSDTGSDVSNGDVDVSVECRRRSGHFPRGTSRPTPGGPSRRSVESRFDRRPTARPPPVRPKPSAKRNRACSAASRRSPKSTGASSRRATAGVPAATRKSTLADVPPPSRCPSRRKRRTRSPRAGEPDESASGESARDESVREKSGREKSGRDDPTVPDDDP